MPITMRLMPSLFTATAAAAALLGPGQALAVDFGVNLRATSGTFCAVNDPALPNGCSASSDPGVSGAVSFGPGSDASLATMATATSSLDTYPFWQQTVGHTVSSATGAADLATASLRLSANGADLNQVGYEAGGTVSAQLHDTLHFAVAGAAAGTTTTIGVTFSILGQMALAPVNSANADLYGTFGVNAGPYGVSKFDLANSTGVTGNKTQGGFDAGGLANGAWASNADFTANVLTGTYTFTGPSQDVFIALTANLNCASGPAGAALCDYGSQGNGLAIALQLPSNVSFTSDSGVFLSAVPEPQAWALMLAGIAGIASLARRRSRAV